jgi:hypothetical protein
MKRDWLLLICILFAFSLISCDSNKNQANSKSTGSSTTTKDSAAGQKSNDTGVVVGGDKDEHGCIGTAGYTWSVVMNDCIRLFESAIRLDGKQSADAANDASLSAFAVISRDQKHAEIFLPGEKSSIVLDAKEEDLLNWHGKGYTLKSWKGGYLLEKDGKQLYAGHPGDRTQ